MKIKTLITQYLLTVRLIKYAAEKYPTLRCAIEGHKWRVTKSQFKRSGGHTCIMPEPRPLGVEFADLPVITLDNYETLKLEEHRFITQYGYYEPYKFECECRRCKSLKTFSKESEIGYSLARLG